MARNEVEFLRIFSFKDYKEYLRAHLQSLPKRGHGQYTKMAAALRVHSTLLTHVMNGDLHLNDEQGVGLADYLKLSPLETEYFLNLIHLARAGDTRTRKFFDKKLRELREDAKLVSARLGVRNRLGEADQAVYYSHWVYTALRLLSAIPEFQNIEAMTTRLAIPKKRAEKAIDFLVTRGLCARVGEKIEYAPLTTYLDSSSPLVAQHHTNWRLKTIDQIDKMRDEDLCFTFPVVMSAEDAGKVREELLRAIEKIKSICDSSPSEDLYSLSIDWLHLKP